MKISTATFCKLFAASALGAIALTACGDDSSTSTDKNDIPQIAKGDSLPECAAANEGEKIFVADSGQTYLCTDGEWTIFGESEGSSSGADGSDDSSSSEKDDGDSLPECTADNEGEKLFVADLEQTYLCEDGEWVIFDESEGSSSDGKNGGNSSSSVAWSSDGSSSSGMNRFDGESSSSAAKVAVCGFMAYDPAEEFCAEGFVYELCGGKTYDVTKYTCEGGIVVGTTAGSFTDSRDGQPYNTVKIGSQTWMAENLNYKTSENSFCYDDDEDNCKTYGRLYTFAAANTACPSGFHLPTREEFVTLISTAGGSSTAGNALKATSGWNDEGNGDDTYGFSALPAGYYNGFFYYAGSYAYFWSATGDEFGARYLILGYNYESADLNYAGKSDALAVRCLKD